MSVLYICVLHPERLKLSRKVRITFIYILDRLNQHIIIYSLILEYLNHCSEKQNGGGSLVKLTGEKIKQKLE